MIAIVFFSLAILKSTNFFFHMIQEVMADLKLQQHLDVFFLSTVFSISISIRHVSDNVSQSKTNGFM